MTMARQETQGRLLWIDYMKGICMMAVILNHCNGPDIYGSLTYPFELVGFFFAAGYTFNPRDRFTAFCVAKIKYLVWPVCCFGILNALLTFMVNGGAFYGRCLGLVLQISGRWDDLWFVACLFTMEMIFYIVLKAAGLYKRMALCLVLFAAGFLYVHYIKVPLPWHLENACIFLVFLHMGYLARHTKAGGAFVSFVRERGRQSVLSFLAVLSLYVLLVLGFKNYPADVHLLDYGSFPLFMAGAVMGLCVVWMLTLYMEALPRNRMSGVIRFIGMNTLVYYALQSKVISTLHLCGGRLGIEESSCIASACYCMLTLVVLIAPACFIKRYIPCLLGKFSLSSKA